MGFKEKSVKGHRVFFALPLGAELTKAVEKWRATLAFDGRFVPANNFHITLAFLGELPARSVDQLMDVSFEGFRPFSLSFGELGYFVQPRVLFLSPLSMPEPLLALAKQCGQYQQRFGKARKEARYQAHITLARDVLPPITPSVQELRLDARFNEVRLYKSQLTPKGPQYHTLQQWPLRPPLRPEPK